MMLWLLALPLVPLAADPLLVQSDFQAINSPNYDLGESLNEPNGLLKVLEQWDVVDVMKLTGHGEGLDEVRRIQVFGEDEIRT